MAKRGNDPFQSFLANVADAGRAVLIKSLLADYKEPTSVLDASPIQHMLAKLLNTDTSFVAYLEAVFTGRLHGSMLVGGLDHPAVALAQSLIVERHGFIQHPLRDNPEPIHPKAKAEIQQFIKHGHSQLGFMSGCDRCLEDQIEDARAKAEVFNQARELMRGNDGD